MSNRQINNVENDTACDVCNTAPCCCSVEEGGKVANLNKSDKEKLIKTRDLLKKQPKAKFKKQVIKSQKTCAYESMWDWEAIAELDEDTIDGLLDMLSEEDAAIFEKEAESILSVELTEEEEKELDEILGLGKKKEKKKEHPVNVHVRRVAKQAPYQPPLGKSKHHKEEVVEGVAADLETFKKQWNKMYGKHSNPMFPDLHNLIQRFAHRKENLQVAMHIAKRAKEAGIPALKFANSSKVDWIKDYGLLRNGQKGVMNILKDLTKKGIVEAKEDEKPSAGSTTHDVTIKKMEMDDETELERKARDAHASVEIKGAEVQKAKMDAEAKPQPKIMKGDKSYEVVDPEGKVMKEFKYGFKEKYRNPGVAKREAEKFMMGKIQKGNVSEETLVEKRTFMLAASAAYRKGLKEFQFNGKTFPVKLKKETMDKIDAKDAKEMEREAEGTVSEGSGAGVEHIQVQLRKVINLRGKYKLEFEGTKKKITLTPGEARTLLDKIDKIRLPKEKGALVRFIGKNPENLKKALEKDFELPKKGGISLGGSSRIGGVRALGEGDEDDQLDLPLEEGINKSQQGKVFNDLIALMHKTSGAMKRDVEFLASLVNISQWNSVKQNLASMDPALKKTVAAIFKKHAGKRDVEKQLGLVEEVEEILDEAIRFRASRDKTTTKKKFNKYQKQQSKNASAMMRMTKRQQGVKEEEEEVEEAKYGEYKRKSTQSELMQVNIKGEGGVTVRAKDEKEALKIALKKLKIQPRFADDKKFQAKVQIVPAESIEEGFKDLVVDLSDAILDISYVANGADKNQLKKIASAVEKGDMKKATSMSKKLKADSKELFDAQVIAILGNKEAKKYGISEEINIYASYISKNTHK